MLRKLPPAKQAQFEADLEILESFFKQANSTRDEQFKARYLGSKDGASQYAKYHPMQDTLSAEERAKVDTGHRGAFRAAGTVGAGDQRKLAEYEQQANTRGPKPVVGWIDHTPFADDINVPAQVQLMHFANELATLQMKGQGGSVDECIVSYTAFEDGNGAPVLLPNYGVPPMDKKPELWGPLYIGTSEKDRLVDETYYYELQGQLHELSRQQYHNNIANRLQTFSAAKASIEQYIEQREAFIKRWLPLVQRARLAQSNVP